MYLILCLIYYRFYIIFFLSEARYNSPIQRLIREEIRRRPPPPTYEEALNNSLFEEPILEGAIVPPLVSPPAIPGVLSQDRIAAVREMSMKPAPTRVDVAVSCDLLGHGVTISPSPSSLMAASPNNAVTEAGIILKCVYLLSQER